MFSQVSLNAWFWSTVFHTRDTYLTEVRVVSLEPPKAVVLSTTVFSYQKIHLVLVFFDDFLVDVDLLHTQ